MSPHGITAPQTEAHGIRGISFHWLHPNVAKFRRAMTKSVPDIRCQNVLTQKK